jgi:2-C-methyl-D-erythritol 4-phosphate cytidylyltransferase
MNAMHAGAADDALTAVILAAGSGSRLGGMPKTWRIWRGMPLWWWSVAAFEAVAAAVVLVVAEDRVDAAGALLAAHARLPAPAMSHPAAA